MGRKVDPRDFLLNTDYEMDKIIYFKETKVTPDQFGDAIIPYSLGFAPLITGLWDRSENFNTPRSFSQTSFLDPITYQPVTDTVSCSAGENGILLTMFSEQIAPFYVRLIGFEPSNSHRKIGKTSQNANKFILNTDYNYLKLYKKGVEDIKINTSSGTVDPITITHNLGYRPQALFWHEISDDYGGSSITKLDYVEIPGELSQKVGIEAYQDKFIVKTAYPQWGSIFKLHYRIYYDEAL